MTVHSYKPVKPSFEFMFRAEVVVAVPLEFGETPRGNRRVIDILGGKVEGPILSGEVLPGGADWQLIRRDGSAVLEARYSIRCRDGALIYVQNFGYRHGPVEIMQRLAKGEVVDPALYYFRATPVFETASSQYDWLNKTLAMSSGIREKDRVILDFYAVR